MPESAAILASGSVIDVLREHADEIAARFPKVLRSNGGYPLDRLRFSADEPGAPATGGPRLNLEPFEFLNGRQQPLFATGTNRLNRRVAWEFKPSRFDQGESAENGISKSPMDKWKTDVEVHLLRPIRQARRRASVRRGWTQTGRASKPCTSNLIGVIFERTRAAHPRAKFLHRHLAALLELDRDVGEQAEPQPVGVEQADVLPDDA